jgi:hypothetical protein
MWLLGFELWTFGRASRVLLPTEPSHQPLLFFFKYFILGALVLCLHVCLCKGVRSWTYRQTGVSCQENRQKTATLTSVVLSLPTASYTSNLAYSFFSQKLYEEACVISEPVCQHLGSATSGACPEVPPEKVGGSERCGKGGYVCVCVWGGLWKGQPAAWDCRAGTMPRGVFPEQPCLGCCFLLPSFLFFFLLKIYVSEYTIALFRHQKRASDPITDGYEPPCGC